MSPTGRSLNLGLGRGGRPCRSTRSWWTPTTFRIDGDAQFLGEEQKLLGQAPYLPAYSHKLLSEFVRAHRHTKVGPLRNFLELTGTGGDREDSDDPVVQAYKKAVLELSSLGQLIQKLAIMETKLPPDLLSFSERLRFWFRKRKASKGSWEVQAT